MRALVRASAKVNERADGVTALWWAAANGFRPIVDDLLRAGADPNVASPAGATPLMMAGRNGHLGVVEALVDAGARLAPRDRRGRDALALAATHDPVVRYLRAVAGRPLSKIPSHAGAAR